jgi:pSer/pThr/pTyr-binding forkhead associated (FHA) protein
VADLAFHILSGGHAGRTIQPGSGLLLAGRDPAATLRFSSELDTVVSARHAELRLQDGRWYVRDLDSRNGTLVNGVPIHAETPLAEGDRLQFGAGGPVVILTRQGGATVVAESTTQRIRAAVRRETRRLRFAVAAVALLGAGVAGAAVINGTRARSTWEDERQRLDLRIDSLLASGRQSEDALAGEVAGLTAALHDSEERLRGLRAQLGANAGNGEEADALRRQLVAVSAALRRQQLAASLDFERVQRVARHAVAMLWVEYADGSRTTGTAFAVREDGLLLTNRHLVAGAEGMREPRRMAVRFADSDQAFPARLVGASSAHDLAAIQVMNVRGQVPIIAQVGAPDEPPGSGTAVAVIGYPLGGEPDQDPLLDGRVARPVVSAALLTRVSNDVIEAEGFGASGASGSPILDGSGRLVGVLFGGRTEDGVQILVGASAAVVADYLATLQ